MVPSTWGSWHLSALFPKSLHSLGSRAGEPPASPCLVCSFAGGRTATSRQLEEEADQSLRTAGPQGEDVPWCPGRSLLGPHAALGAARWCPVPPPRARPHPSSLRLAAPGPCSRRAGYRETSLGSWASPRPLRARARPRSPAAACSRPPPGPCGRRAPLAQARGAPPRPRPTFPGHLQTPRRARRGGPGAAAGAGAGLPSAARRAGGAAPGLAVRLNWVKATLNTVALCAN